MPADVRAAFLRSIRKDHRVFFKAISGVQTAKCEAGDPEDKRRIGAVIEQAGGYGKIDQLVIGKLKEWFVSVLQREIDASTDELDKVRVAGAWTLKPNPKTRNTES